MTGKKLIVRGSIVLLVWLLLTPQVQAQQAPESRTGRFVVGADIGVQGGTADGTAFALGLRGDYFLTHNVSVGPLLQFGITDDLFQIAPTLQVKYTLDFPGNPNVTLHFEGGIGFIHADLDRRGLPGVNDTSYLIPVGLGIEFKVDRNISIGSTLLFNFTDMDDIPDDDFFVTWLTGIRIRF